MFINPWDMDIGGVWWAWWALGTFGIVGTGLLITVAIRRPRSTPIWKLEASLKCRSCRKGRYAPPVHMIRLTETQEIAPYPWVHPDEER